MLTWNVYKSMVLLQWDSRIAKEMVGHLEEKKRKMEILQTKTDKPDMSLIDSNLDSYTHK